MDKVAMGLFEDEAAANAAVAELAKHGIAREHIHMLHPEPGAAGTAHEQQGGAFHRFLEKIGLVREPEAAEAAASGMAESESRLFAEGVNRGGTIVAVEVPDEAALVQAEKIFEDAGAVDIDERAADWRKGGWVDIQKAAPAPSAPATGEQVTVPVVEESLQVGKREVRKPGVRVFKRVTTRPVEEEVKLREEEVKVERRPADRPATPADLQKAAEGVVIPVVAEEAVVAKQPHVVEEVVVRKEVQERAQPVQAEVRREEVAVERSPGGPAEPSRAAESAPVAQTGSETADGGYREHFQRVYGSSGNDYDVYLPAYHFGAELARSTGGGSDWKSAEREARREWDQQQPGSWDNFRAAIQYGFEHPRVGRATVTRPAESGGAPAGAAGEREPIKPPMT